MMSDILCSIKPHELDKRMRRGLNDIVERVTANAVMFNLGRDLLLLVYMAGFSHGAQAMEGRLAPASTHILGEGAGK